MDYKYIEQLIERYFEGETSLKEEQILRNFFEQSEEELPRELSAYREFFVAMQPEEALGSDFDDRMLALVGEADDVPHVKARTISLAERLKPFFRAAAVLAVVLTLSNALNQSFNDQRTWADESDYALRQMEPAADKPAMACDLSTDTLRNDSLHLSTGYLE